jgi:hypothetical protein
MIDNNKLYFYQENLYVALLNMIEATKWQITNHFSHTKEISHKFRLCEFNTIKFKVARQLGHTTIAKRLKFEYFRNQAEIIQHASQCDKLYGLTLNGLIVDTTSNMSLEELQKIQNFAEQLLERNPLFLLVFME